MSVFIMHIESIRLFNKDLVAPPLSIIEINKLKNSTPQQCKRTKILIEFII